MLFQKKKYYNHIYDNVSFDKISIKICYIIVVILLVVLSLWLIFK